MRNRSFKCPSLLVALLFVAGCHNSTGPATASLAGVSVRFEAYLWRDFQPIAPPDGQPLIMLLRFVTSDSTPIPATFQADSAWVTNSADVWATRVAEESARTPGAPYFDVLARNGPKWGPGIEVDVAVRLHDAAGRSVLLHAHRQLIVRTD